MTSIDDLPDLFGPAMLADPYATYAELRDRDPVHWSAALDSWVLTRFADVSAALRDPAFSSRFPLAPPAAELDRQVPAQTLARVYTFVRSSLVFSDPPEHTRLRRLVNRAFAPGVVEALSDVIATTADELLQYRSGEVDLISELAEPLPMRVLGQLLGVSLSPTEGARLKGACEDFLLPFGRDLATLTDEEIVRAESAGREIDEFVTSVLDRPGGQVDDVVGRLIEGEAQDRLTRRELFANIVLLLVAGHVNLTSLLGDGTAILLDLPHVLQDVQREPALWPDVVDELLRLVTPNQFIRRQMKAEVVLDDRLLAAGQGVLLVLAAANRDPARFPDPDTFQLHRADRRDVAMGLGLHYCLGAPLARLQTRIALRRLFDRYPDVHRTDAALDYVPNFNVRLLRALPVVLR